ncbi:MAG: BON domain-containing protein [Thermoleophilaceae bacterium]|jgi:hypothetical protein
MGLLRGIGRAAPFAVGAAAAAWYLRRQGFLGGRPQLAAGTWPPAEDEAPPEPEPPAPSAHDPEPDAPIEAHVDAVEAVSDASDVTSVVEDLLAVAPGEEPAEIVDADVVIESEPDIAGDVRAALADIPESGSLGVEATGGVVWLRGELERPDAITRAERAAADVEGVTEVRNLLHLPGTPPPSG